MWVTVGSRASFRCRRGRRMSDDDRHILRTHPPRLREFAADLVQDTFEAAALDWATVRALAWAQQRAWLRTTLSHKDASHFRRRLTFRRQQPELYRKYSVTDPDPELQALSRIALERTAKIIEGLPSRQRRIALMKWNDHIEESEIATELGCSKGTVSAEVQEDPP